MKTNPPKNQIETESKNRLIKLSGSVLVFVLHKSWFRFIKYKNHGFGKLTEKKKNYKIGFPICVSCGVPIFIHCFYFFLPNQTFIIFLQTKAYRL